MTGEERLEVERAVKHSPFKLVRSTKKHVKDGDEKQLKARIEEAFKELHSIAEGLRSRWYRRAPMFIVRHARFMVTFAE